MYQLEKPYFTTTRHNHKKKLNAKEKRALSDHEKWLQRVGLDDKSLKKKLKHDKKGRRIGMCDLPNYKEDQRVGQSQNKSAGNGFAKESNTYTGTLIKGIATMHKSNAVPVISKEDAINIANMRRG